MISTLLDSVELSGSHLSTRVVTKGLSCMKKIKLTQGKYALVDDADYEWLSQWKWHTNNGYAARRDNANAKTILMHREILKTPDGLFTDHINRKRHDNRRKNLRVCTKSQNNRNVKARGYYWHKASQKWEAQIMLNWKVKHLGLFKNKADARKAYLVEYNKCF